MAARTTDLRKFTGGGTALWALIGLIALIVLGAVFLLVKPGAGPQFSVSAGGSQAAPSQTVNITMHGQHFNVDRDTVRAGQPVSIVLVNNNTMNHQFTISDLGIDSGPIRPGQTVTVTFTPDMAGDYRYICPMPGHVTMGMFGTLHVTE